MRMLLCSHIPTALPMASLYGFALRRHTLWTNQIKRLVSNKQGASFILCFQKSVIPTIAANMCNSFTLQKRIIFIVMVIVVASVEAQQMDLDQLCDETLFTWPAYLRIGCDEHLGVTRQGELLFSFTSTTTRPTTTSFSSSLHLATKMPNSLFSAFLSSSWQHFNWLLYPHNTLDSKQTWSQ